MEVEKHMPWLTAREGRRLAVVAGVWALLMGTYAAFLHAAFRSSALDLALHTQLLWNANQGHGLVSSLLAGSDDFLARHIWPLLLAFAPLQAVGGVGGLIAAQILALAAGVFPAYALALEITSSRRWAWIFAAFYLAHPAIACGALDSIHLEALTVGPMLAALLAYRLRRPWAFAAAALLAVSAYEVAAGVWAVFGLILLLAVPDRRRWGAVTLALSLLWLALAVGGVMTLAGGGAAHVPHWAERFGRLGATPAEALGHALRHPVDTLSSWFHRDKIWALTRLSAAVGFLCLCSLRHLTPALPLLAILLLSTFGVQVDPRYGYIAPTLPFFFFAAMHGVRRLRPWAGRAPKPARAATILALLAAAALLFDTQIRRPLRRHPFRLRANLPALREAVARVPPGASLSADNHIGPHLAQRRVLLLTPAASYRNVPVDYVLSDLREADMKPPGCAAALRALIEERGYGVLDFRDGVLWLGHGRPGDPGLRAAALQALGQ